MGSMKEMNQRAGVSAQDFILTATKAVACLVTYWIISHCLFRYLDRADDLLGGMWAAVATTFVFRETRSESFAAGVSRLIATAVSFVLCAAYLWILPFNAMGMVALLAIGTFVMKLRGRRDGIVTASVTTIVVLVVAAIDPRHAAEQPLLRFVDTVVGVASGLCWRSVGSLLVSRIGGREPAR
jgi:uncharacterized membrane protein YgaE (UPF0421/DUF939 family)